MTVVPRNVRLAEAPSHGLPALAYDRNSKGARAYVALASEIVARDAGSIQNPSPDPSPNPKNRNPNPGPEPNRNPNPNRDPSPDSSPSPDPDRG